MEGVHRGMKQFSSIDDTKKDLIDIAFHRDSDSLFETTEFASMANARTKSRKNNFYYKNSINRVRNV